MKKYLISLEVVSSGLSLEVLSELLRCKPSRGSHSIGDFGFRKRRWGNTTWKKEVGVFNDSNLNEAFDRIEELCSKFSENINEIVKTYKETEVFLEIGITSTTASISLDLPFEILANISAHGINLSVTTYPVEE